MKDSPGSASEVEQKKFSFDMNAAGQRTKTEVKSRREPESTSADQYLESGVAASRVDDVVPLSGDPAENERGILPGAVLSAERKRRGFTIKEIAAQLFLTEKQINALEMDDYDRFPASIFVTGYIRNYARLLDLPSDPLIELFTAQGAQSAPELNRGSRTDSHIKAHKPSLDLRIVGAVIAAVVLVPLLWWGMSPSDETMTAAGVTSDEMAAANSELVVPFNESRDAFNTPVEVVSSPALMNISLPEVREAPAALNEEMVVFDVITDVEAPPIPEFIADKALAATLPDKLALTFTAESWTEITDANGRRVMFDLGKPGQTRALSGTAPFKVLFGYSPGVSMVYNGEPFDQSKFARGKVARFTLGKRRE